jgi:hypothetical protein
LLYVIALRNYYKQIRFGTEHGSNLGQQKIDLLVVLLVGIAVRVIQILGRGPGREAAAL